MTFESTTSAAAQVRAALKARGWSSRQVSVRADYFSMGSSIRVQIKDGSVPFHPVRRAAERKERIDRDASGEILSGGNRFVNVDLTDDARREKAARYFDQVEGALGLLPDPSNGVLQDVIPGFMVGRDPVGRLQLWGVDSHIVTRDSAEEIAFHIAVHMEDDPECSMCRGRHPSDDRHPCE